MNRGRRLLLSGIALMAVAAASTAVIVARRDQGATVTTVGQTTVPITLPEAPVTFEGVAARLDCPAQPDPNGPSDVRSVVGDYPAGVGDPTPEAALASYLREVFPRLDPAAFVLTARDPGTVRYEASHIALLVSGAEGGVWNVDAEMYCATYAAEWTAGR